MNADILRAGLVGLRARRLRSVLSGLGVAIGIAAMVSVLGVSSSSRADLLAELDRLGTNLLRVSPGQSFFGEDSELPETARAMLSRARGVTDAAAVRSVSSVTVRRTPYIAETETGGISVMAADTNLAETLGARMQAGRFLDAATARYPAVVLGATAARRLGVSRVGVRLWIGGRWFTVVGILEPVTLASGLDEAALVGFPVAQRLLGAEKTASTVYVRTDPDSVEDVRALLGATANPQRAEEVQVSRPSDALEARAAAKTAFTTLLLGLGAVALLVGGVGIANVMVVAVLERRGEIGLRRALGARRRHVAVQFLTEAVALSGAGGAAGALLGAGVTGVYALAQGWKVSVPPVALAGGVVAALLIGAVAGLYPALRAARLAPAEALRTI
jgi:putative ABC transport system permease protein